MKTIGLLVVLLVLAGCGIESASTAATAAALKKQEVEQGRKTLEQFQQKLDQANQAAQQRTEQAAGDK